MTAKELRNEIVNRLWSYGNLPKNIQTLMTDNEVDFMMEVIKTHEQEQLNLYNVSNFVLLAKPNYKAKDGTIKRGIEIDGKYYAPKNDC